MNLILFHSRELMFFTSVLTKKKSKLNCSNVISNNTKKKEQLVIANFRRF